MPKRGRRPESDVRQDIKATIAKLTVDSQPHPKINDKVLATSADFKEQAKKHPGWRDLRSFSSPRTIYALLKRFRSNEEK